jgi:hypothetical protein
MRKEKHHHTHTFEEVDLFGHDAHIEVKYETEIVDNGIGVYEFWGTNYTDIRLEHETQATTVVFVWWENDEGTYWASGDDMTEEVKRFVDAAIEYVSGEHETLDDKANNV